VVILCLSEDSEFLKRQEKERRPEDMESEMGKEAEKELAVGVPTPPIHSARQDIWAEHGGHLGGVHAPRQGDMGGMVYEIHPGKHTTC
jgi:hypothetical protein